ncbi:uncharacterized protein K489DRAFT_419092 [Dissoconium aciculare CBS 342.82]|uniref:Uncharacterized protein n=1 Tax=Dissoconium aciculare CBS 342.82 TaxID=1314786 RepID=A0A6J3MD59_9PEZI|nr:uncharacterized protein K489DRAFT_419092 [Dissoconium aciculare CBS 342.82]KAF1825818.1 hypothetical protein K489DRAFT_419092 [Dissoconium aciculare CBS 342.82]
MTNVASSAVCARTSSRCHSIRMSICLHVRLTVIPQGDDGSDGRNLAAAASWSAYLVGDGHDGDGGGGGAGGSGGVRGRNRRNHTLFRLSVCLPDLLMYVLCLCVSVTAADDLRLHTTSSDCKVMNSAYSLTHTTHTHIFGIEEEMSETGGPYTRKYPPHLTSLTLAPGSLLATSTTATSHRAGANHCSPSPPIIIVIDRERKHIPPYD